jgi:hypothetical protein
LVLHAERCSAENTVLSGLGSARVGAAAGESRADTRGLSLRGAEWGWGGSEGHNPIGPFLPPPNLRPEFTGETDPAA